MSKETDALIQYMRDAGVSFGPVVTTQGQHAPSSYHYAQGTNGQGLAVDFGIDNPSYDDSRYAVIFSALVHVETQLAELIYAGPQVGFNISHGVRVPKYAQEQHHNHVHVAVPKGTFVHWPGGVVKPAEVKPMTRFPNPVAAMRATPKGTWVVGADGGIGTYGGAPFFGSYPGLPSAARQGDRACVDAEVTARGGYVLIFDDGNTYEFGPGLNGF